MAGAINRFLRKPQCNTTGQGEYNSLTRGAFTRPAVSRPAGIMTLNRYPYLLQIASALPSSTLICYEILPATSYAGILIVTSAFSSSTLVSVILEAKISALSSSTITSVTNFYLKLLTRGFWKFTSKINPSSTFCLLQLYPILVSARNFVYLDFECM